jgi:hypothetical protein
MAEPQLSVRSARARDLAHELAARERRTVAQVVEQALELYKRQSSTHSETMAAFLARLRENAVDVDLEAVIKEGWIEKVREFDL